MSTRYTTKLRMHTDPSDGRSVIDTRILALVVGALSLAFGIWAATGAPSEVALSAGALGFVAGLTALVPRDSRHSLTGGETANASHAPDGAHAEVPGETRGPNTTVELGAAEDTATSKAGYFDRDPAHDRHGVRPVGAPTTPDNSGARTADAAPAGPPEAEVAAGSADAAPVTTPLTDPVTGLFSEDYLVVALEGRLASARRHLRPVALALLQITQGLPDAGSRPADPKLVAEAISHTVRDSDIACRMSDGTFGVILEDTPENGAVWTVERIRRNLVSTSGHHTLWAGVACYPAHAFDVGELMTQVHEALDLAKEWNQDRIEVAVAE